MTSIAHSLGRFRHMFSVRDQMVTMRSTRSATGDVILLLAVPCFYFLLVAIKEKSREASLLSAATSEQIQSQVVPSFSSSCRCDSQGPETMTSTSVSEDELDTTSSGKDDKKMIYVITPTYTRATQMADMTTLAQTLMFVKNVLWVVSEDANEKSDQVSALLKRTGIPYVHLLGPRPPAHRNYMSGRGVSNRREALHWLRDKLANTATQGVIYFADDDNTYDVRIFEEMRSTIKVSVWPVGLVGRTGLSSPVIDSKSGLVVAFHDPWIKKRRFAVDMAGFAVDLQLFLSKPKATMPYKAGYLEDYFIRSLGVAKKDLEPKANNCTQILVWHSKTMPAPFPSYANLKETHKYMKTNLPQLYKNVIQTTGN